MEYDYEKFLSDSSDDHPKYADGIAVQDPVQKIKYLNEGPYWNSAIKHILSDPTDADLERVVESFSVYKRETIKFFNENTLVYSSGRVLTDKEKSYQLRESLKFGMNTIKRIERKLNNQ